MGSSGEQKRNGWGGVWLEKEFCGSFLGSGHGENGINFMGNEENQVSLRFLFSGMPPLRHNRVPEASPVLAHIRDVLGCDLDRASKAFDSMRNHRSRVVVFDGVDKTWHGCFWTPSEGEARDRKIWREMMALHRDFSALRSEVRKLKKKLAGQKREAKVKEEPVEPEEPAPTRTAKEEAPDMHALLEAELRKARAAAASSQADPDDEDKPWIRRVWMGCCDGCGYPDPLVSGTNITCGACGLRYHEVRC